jgi:mono/diheme cytochrome c family protein
MYAALAANPLLASALYPVTIVWNGKNGMPPVGRYLDDAQIAAVVNYVRTHFGNSYADTLSAADVKKISNRP